VVFGDDIAASLARQLAHSSRELSCCQTAPSAASPFDVIVRVAPSGPVKSIVGSRLRRWGFAFQAVKSALVWKVLSQVLRFSRSVRRGCLGCAQGSELELCSVTTQVQCVAPATKTTIQFAVNRAEDGTGAHSPASKIGEDASSLEKRDIPKKCVCVFYRSESKGR
jgi:hypothetical protein